MTFTELMLQKFPNADLRNLFIDCCPLVGDYITTKKKNNNETLVAV